MVSHLHKEAAVSVNHIGYSVDDGRYLVYFAAKSVAAAELNDAIQRLRWLSDIVTEPYAGITVHGDVVNFSLQPGVEAAEALPRVIDVLKPTCPATAEMLRLQFFRYTCTEHGFCDVLLLMAPGLGVADEEAFIAELNDGLRKIGLPHILPLKSDSVPVTVFAAISMICRQLDVYAQSIHVTADTPTVCPICTPPR
jgi:hypothetical protein